MIEKMWAALEAKQSAADAAGCGKQWAAMCKRQTLEAVNDAWRAAPKRSAFHDALWHVWEALDAMREVDRPARRAIAALRRAKP